MPLRTTLAFLVGLVSLPCASHGLRSETQVDISKHPHGHHSKRRLSRAAKKSTTDAAALPTQAETAGQHHTRRLSALAKTAAVKQKTAASLAGAGEDSTGTIEVNGPLPPDFNERFIQAVAKAAKIPTSQVSVLDSHPYGGADGPDGLFEIKFSAPEEAVNSIMDQAADADSDLANSPLHWFLIAKDGGAEEAPVDDGSAPAQPDEPPAASAGSGGLDVDTEMPFGELAPFGREDTAKELTEQSIDESNEMVDQLERAEVAEEKRAIFRALTRLRGAAITSFDGIARSQTGNIDQYTAVNKWRAGHPLQHLAQEESDVSAWAFPSQSD